MSTFAKDVTLSLGLVTTKIRLEPVRDNSKKEATAFKMGHACPKGQYNPINQKKWCSACDIEVTDPVKLRAVDGGYAAFTTDEVRELKSSSLTAEMKKKISLTQHDTVDVMRHTQPSGAAYYIYTSTGGNDEALGALTEYVKTHPEKTLVSVISLREGSEHMARLGMANDHLILEMLLWPGEVSRPKPEEHTVRPGMVELLGQIAGSVDEKFDPETYASTFADVVAEAERAKMPGSGSIDLTQLKARDRKRVGGMDLMEAMEAYVAGLPAKK